MRNTILSILLAGMLAATVATATEQRANALMYNLALEDDTDIFLFPTWPTSIRGSLNDAPQSYTDVSGVESSDQERARWGLFEPSHHSGDGSLSDAGAG